MVYVAFCDFKIVLHLYWRWCSAPTAEWPMHECHTVKFSRFSISVGKTIHWRKADIWWHYSNLSDCAIQLPSWHNHNLVLNWACVGQRACWSTFGSNKTQRSGLGVGCVGHINSVQLLQTFSFLFRAFISQNFIRNKYTDPMSKEMTSGIAAILFQERMAQKKTLIVFSLGVEIYALH